MTGVGGVTGSAPAPMAASMAMPIGVADVLTIIDVDEAARDTMGPMNGLAGPLRLTPTTSLGLRLLHAAWRPATPT
jgi:hypothetical protein